ncbi:hypothetical protein GCM10010464_29990 [Pseudonocardia yunnanensis]|uniref:Uncharacterized protein n=1 Tax=Pseudonocardia yunnanensis TaxID=58107 RepID=A0ABW4F1X9_9PSEU
MTVHPTIDLAAARDFMATHARPLDRHRLRLLLGEGGPQAALAALEAYSNADGGYGWGLEPDLRSCTSQPGAALHAFEVFAEIGPTTSPRASALCDWLESVSLADGGLPFALPVRDPAGTAAWWAHADPRTSSLQITAIVTAVALQVARHDPAVAAHPWLAGATRYCLGAIRTMTDAPHALVLAFALRFLDALHDKDPAAAAVIAKLGVHVPASGVIPVEGGTENEVIRPLDIAPVPGRPVRALFAPEVVTADLHRLAAAQQDDGGWRVEYAQFSPAGALDWRGHATVGAVTVLWANGPA